jgi:cobalt-zinc-cadmium efflux system outer membrane protein
VPLRERAELYRAALVPLRARAVHETQGEFNNVTAGLPQLLRAKRDEVESVRKYVDAVRDYWIVRAEIDQLLSGGA